MRIGILTLPLNTNYGGILQAYALQTVLERMGHEVVVFQNNYNGIRNFPIYKLPFLWTKRFIRNCVKGNTMPVFFEMKRKSELSIVTQHTARFINSYIHSYHVESISEISSSDVDAIVVGSDQIWRRSYFRRIWNTGIEDAYLDFISDNKIKRIAYAVSFGKDVWDYSKRETEKCKDLVRLFNAISVREDTAVGLCLNNLGVKVQHVLDPTMLLSRQDYINLINKAEIQPSDGSLFAYILDKTPEKISFINSIAAKKGMKPFFIDYLSMDFSKPVGQRVVPPVESWLRGFYDAKLVITDSFHGCVFSIIFGRPFIAIGNARRGIARFKSLLRMFDAEDCLITDINSDTFIKLPDISDDIEKNLQNLRRKSYSFLTQALIDNNMAI